MQYCGRPGLGPIDLLRGWIPGGGAAIPDWPQLRGERVLLTHQARQAIYLLCKTWNVGAGDEVLMPSYNCGVEVDAVLKAGASVQLYRVDLTARIDMDDLRRRVTSRTRIVYIIHYFGWPHELGDMVAWCRSKGLLVLEDCALCLFSDGPSGPIGSAGDGAVFSFPKTLPTPDGGALVIRDSSSLKSPISQPSGSPDSRKVMTESLALLKSRLMRQSDSIGLYPVARRLIPSRNHSQNGTDAPAGGLAELPGDYFFDPAAADWTASSTTMRVLRRVDPADVRQRRRKNFLVLRDELGDCPGVRLLMGDPPAGVCPLALPVLVHNRDRWVEKLIAKGIIATPWWGGYHRGVRWDEFPEARMLKENVLALPVYQNLDGRHMRHIAAVMRNIAGAET